MLTFWRKINQHILENHPLLWHSKFVPLMVVSAVLWLLSCVIGFLLVGPNDFVSGSVTQFYGEKNYVFFHLIALLMVLVVWAISFFKNNAVRNFYPISRSYLIRLFVLLFLPFSLLVSAYLPFTAGVNMRFKTLYSADEIQQDWSTLNYGAAFLLVKPSDYKLRMDDFGIPNLAYLSRPSDGGGATQFNEYFRNDPTAIYQETRDSSYRFDERDAALWPISVIDGKAYWFFTYVQKYEGPDSCRSQSFADSFITVNQDQQAHWFALTYFDTPLFRELSATRSQALIDTLKLALPLVVKKNDKSSVVQTVRRVEQLARKYGVGYAFDPELIANYLEAKKYIHLSERIFNYDVDESAYFSNHPLIQKYSELTPVDSTEADELIRLMEDDNALYFHSYGFDRLFDNFQTVEQGLIDDELWGFVVAAFLLTMLFLVFEFAHVKSLLLAIPVIGVLTILIGLTIVLVGLRKGYDAHYVEQFSIVLVFLVMSSVIGAMLYLLFAARSRKTWLNVLFHLSYVVAPFYFNVLFGVFYVFSGSYEDSHPCYDYRSYEYALQPLVHPAVFFGLALLGVFLHLGLVRIWRAKEE